MSNAASNSARVTLAPIQGRRFSPARGGARGKTKWAEGSWDQAAQPGDAEPGRVPCFVAGPENELLSAVFNQLIASFDLDAGESDAGQSDAGQSNAPSTDLPSPILLVGPTGSGKTHLAQGIVELWRGRRQNRQQSRGQKATGGPHLALNADPLGGNAMAGDPLAGDPLSGESDAVCLTAADFRRALADAIDRKAVRDFRRRVRRLRLLVIDDAHRLGDSEASATELRHTLDALADRGAVVLLTMQGPVAERGAFDRPTLSRLAGGLTLEIAPPGRDARRELLRQASAAAGCTLDDEALDTLADQLPPEPTQVLRAVAELRRRRGTKADAAAAQQLLDDDRQQQTPALRDILRVVARYHQVPLRVLTSASRKQGVVAARAVAIYLARRLTPLSYAEIGQALGGRDHTTVMHNYRRIVRELPKDRALQSAVEDLKRLLTTP